jgi:hypothetical protein
LNSIKAAATSDVVINHHGWFFHQTYTRIGSQHIMR